MTDSILSEQSAIEAALHHHWAEAISINTELLKSDKTNTNILNRLGFAYLQTGNLEQAKRIFQKAIALDEYNLIAIKNVKKLSTLRQKDIVNSPNQYITPMLFLEEPGKTKIVECVNAATIQTLSSLSPGQVVMLKARNHVVEVRTEQNVYLGALPDDVSFRLIKYLSGGNVYQVLVKSIGKNTVTVFIREQSRGKRFIHQPTFATNGYSMPYPKVTDIHEKNTSDFESETAED